MKNIRRLGAENKGIVHMGGEGVYRLEGVSTAFSVWINNVWIL